MNRSEPQADSPDPIEGVRPNESVIRAERADDPSQDSVASYPSDRAIQASRNSPTGDLINLARGFCMGAADTVPGISGGTIALILGHYQRLITAISRFDMPLIRMLAARKVRAAAVHIDLRFIAVLLAGILLGVVTLAGLMHWLLENRISQTLAVFLGLMIASIWVVQKEVTQWTPSRLLTMIGGIAVAVAITLLPTGTGSMSLPYVFFAASIAICAMILPGISGAFVLLLLGVYHSVTGLIKDAVRMQFTTQGLLQMLVFGCGCVFGLLAFSRLLHWLLEHYRQATMAGLMGLMIGSMGKLWPLQRATPETAELEMKFQVMEYVSPVQYGGSLPWLGVLCIGSAIAVWLVERKAVS